eukprot:2938890-Pyramimonas_sp.AAC.2
MGSKRASALSLLQIVQMGTAGVLSATSGLIWDVERRADRSRLTAGIIWGGILAGGSGIVPKGRALLTSWGCWPLPVWDEPVASIEERGNTLGARTNYARREGIYSEHGPIA